MTTASRYSLALYELSHEENSLEEVESHSNLFLKLIHESEDFNSLIKDPTNSVEDLNNVLSKIAETYNLNKLLTKFLSFLISKRRFFFVQLILKDFVNTCSKKRGEIKASLISSKELSKSELDEISKDLSATMGSILKFDYKVDKELIGGLKLQLGSFMIDTSIKSKLKKYEQIMLES